MVHVADGADVHVRLGALEFCLGHGLIPAMSVDATASLTMEGGASGVRPLPLSELPLHLADDLFRLRLRNFLVVGELHRVHGPSLGHRPQLRGIPEHLARAARVAAMTWASPRCVMPPILPRRDDRSPSTSPMYASGVTTSTFIIGSSSTGCACFAASLNAIEPGDLERHFARVDVVVRAVRSARPSRRPSDSRPARRSPALP